MATWFETWYDALMRPLERSRLGSIRQEMIGRAKGNVLELGSGTGLNFQYYGKRTAAVTAVEPSDAMREQSRERARAASVPITVLPGQGENLPFPDDTFDTVVLTLVLCSVSDLDQTLRELRRVCKPLGQVLLFEHVRMKKPLLGKLQDLLTPAWSCMFDGCRLNRDPVERLQRMDFRLRHVDGLYDDLFVLIEAENGKPVLEAKLS